MSGLIGGCPPNIPNAADNANANANSADEYPYDTTTYGAILPLEAEIRSYPKAISPRAFQSLSPAQLGSNALLSNTPPIGQQGPCSLCTGQGSPGSCIAWSFGYGLGSYTANLTQNWGIDDPAHLVSPAFLYEYVLNEQSAACPAGTECDNYLNYLVQYGAVSLATAPYVANCTDLNGVNLNDPPNPSFQIGSWSFVKPTDRELIKQALAAGHAVAFAGHLYDGFGQVTGSDVYYGRGSFEVNAHTGKLVGHGMMLIGYDDNRGDPDKGLGAYRIQNSFGTSWGDGGYLWMSYETFESSILAAYVANPVESVQPALVTLTPDPATSAPAGRIVEAFQFLRTESDGTQRVFLVFKHQFDAPVEIRRITVTDPSGASVAHSYNVWHRHGYTHISRTDGFRFLDGNYTLTITAGLSDGTTTTYTGEEWSPPPPDIEGEAAALFGGELGGNGEPVESP